MFLQTSYQNPVLLSGTNAYKPRKSNKPAFFYGSGITKIRKNKENIRY